LSARIVVPKTVVHGGRGVILRTFEDLSSVALSAVDADRLSTRDDVALHCERRLAARCRPCPVRDAENTSWSSPLIWSM
jgi:hypothetical protein